MFNTIITYDTNKSTLSYKPGDKYVEVYSKTLNSTFRAKANSDRGRYLINLIARKGGSPNHPTYMVHETSNNVFGYKIGDTRVYRFDKNRQQESWTKVDKNWRKWSGDVVIGILRRGMFV